MRLPVPEKTRLVPTVVVLEDESVVKLPAAGDEPPIAGGEARYVLKPVPDTVELALKVVNAPAAAVRLPIVMPLSVWVQAGLVPSVVRTFPLLLS